MAGLLNKTKLTDAAVARAQLPEGRSDLVVWDTEVTGFGLRIRPSGKSWIVAYRPVGAGRSAGTTKLRLGTPATIRTVAEARRLALATLGKVAAGGDPAAEREERKRREHSRVGELLDRYEKELERRGYVNRSTVMSGLRQRLAGHANDDIRDLSGADLARIISRLQAVGKFGAAEDFRSRCRAFLTWCMVNAKVLPSNPLTGHRKERPTRADRIAKAERGRALTDGELEQVWRAADASTSFGRLLQFLILTGCRRGEGAGLVWAMVDRDAGVIRLPAQFVKQGRGHNVPIAPALARVLDACSAGAPTSPVFASRKTAGVMSGWSDMMREFCAAAGVQFTLHDLRRTFRTGLSRLGVSDDLAELALGHARSNLEAIYNRDEAAEALRKAFVSWAEHVEMLTAQKTQNVFD